MDDAARGNLQVLAREFNPRIEANLTLKRFQRILSE
jgi:hypothetical protein